jgi:type II secretory pathway component PulM
MTARDRIVVMVIATLGVLAGVWFLAVAPKREQAAKLATEVSAAKSTLASAESQLASASAAQAKYQSAYASIVKLGKAVPAGQEVPSLIYQLAQATNEKNVEFASIAATVPGASSGAAAGPSAAASPSATATAGFTQMPFTFVFNGGFNGLYSLFRQLDGFAQRTRAGLKVDGRLLTIQSVKLALAPSSGASAGGSAPGAGSAQSSEQLTGTITATAYVLPAGQTLTGGATPAGPAGATSTQTASTGASGASPSPAAVVGATP